MNIYWLSSSFVCVCVYLYNCDWILVWETKMFVPCVENVRETQGLSLCRSMHVLGGGDIFLSVNSESQWAMVWKAWNKKLSASKWTAESTINTYHPVPGTEQAFRLFMAKWTNKWVTTSFCSDKGEGCCNAWLLNSQCVPLWRLAQGECSVLMFSVLSDDNSLFPLSFISAS